MPSMSRARGIQFVERAQAQQGGGAGNVSLFGDLCAATAEAPLMIAPPPT